MIRIEVGSAAEGFDLRESLARRGIQSVVVEAAAGWELELTSPREQPERLFVDVAEGVEWWLAGRGGTGLVVHVGLERRTIEPIDPGGIVARPEGGPISAEEAPQAPVAVAAPA
jgi:hypothetical protein